MSDIKEATAEFKDQLYTLNEDGKQDITIELEPSKESKESEDVANDTERVVKKKKNRTNPSQQIARYSQEKRKALEYAYENEARAAQLAQENEDLRYRLSLKEQIAQSHIEHSLKVKAAAAEQELRRAKDAGDTDSEIEYTKLLNNFNTELLLQKNQEQQRPAQQQYNYNPAPQYYEPEPEYVNPNYEAWVSENSWADPNSDDFDPELTQEAEMAANALNKQLKLSGMSELVGTPEYYSEISNYISQSYGVAPDVTPRGRSNQAVAPVNYSSRGNTNMTSNNKGTVQMSKVELELAHKTQLFHADGRPYTNKEKELAVAKAKYNLERKKR
jgi:hypothetical protein